MIKIVNPNQSRKFPKRPCVCVAAAIIGLLFLATPAFAADGQWRPTYDKVMLYVNFFILVFILVRYGRKPLMNFLQGQKDEVADQIHRLQKQKNAIEAEIEKARSMIEASNVRFEQIKSRIIEDGERTKQEIIDSAREQSKNIIENEKLKATNQITQAKERFMSELVDEASFLAQTKLPSEITDSDHDKLLDLFISNISNVSKQTTA